MAVIQSKHIINTSHHQDFTKNRGGVRFFGICDERKVLFMKRNKIVAFLMSAVMTFGVTAPTISAADTAVEKSEYQYFLKTDSNSAYVELGEEIKGRNIEFIDGLAQGITDKEDPLYNELVNLDGLDARKQYTANSWYFKFSNDFYEAGDSEMLFSIVFYDFGPSEGKFYFEYHSTDGTTKEVTLTKSGTNPGWYVRTVCINDIDFTNTYENGAAVKVRNGAYNAFRKIEAVNISKARREMKTPEITCLGNDALLELAGLYIMNANDKNYSCAKMSEPVTAYDVREITKVMTGKSKEKNTESKKENLTQGELLTMLADAAGIKKQAGESAVAMAIRTGLAKNGFFLYDDAPASRHNLLTAAYAALISYETESGDSLLGRLIDGGFYDDKDVSKITNTEFTSRYHTSGGEYDYFENHGEESAYAILGDKIEQSGMEFLDGLTMGQTNSGDALYNEKVNLDGLEARKQYSANSAYFKVDKDFYEEGDTEFLFSIVFYDFGPSEGKFYFEYHSTDGSIKQVTFVKPGTSPGWAVRSVCVDDMDVTKTYENGATIRIQNGAYNAFRKAELVNVSKARREKSTMNMTALGNGIMLELGNLYILDKNDERYTNAKMANPATRYDIQELLNVVNGTPNAANTASKTATMTQGELATLLMNAAGLTKNNDESAVDAAKRLGVVDAAAFMYNDTEVATNYNLINAVYAALVLTNASGNCLLNNLIDGGYYADKQISKIKNSAFLSIYYAIPRKMPYTVIYDNTTGREYKYVNFFGEDLGRPYLTEHCWLLDGSGFLCSTSSGDMFIYDINTQMMKYVDTTNSALQLSACVCPNGYIYYTKRGLAGAEIWRCKPETLEKECMFQFPSGVSSSITQLTNDGRYMALEFGNISSDNWYFEREDNEYPIVVLDLEKKEMTYRTFSFPYSNWLNHRQINPEDPNIVAFSHECILGEVGSYAQIYDRTWIMYMNTGEAVPFNQGRYGTNTDSIAKQMFTHEMWSIDGEYRYLCFSGISSKNQDIGQGPGIAVFRKDGTHPQYYQILYNSVGAANHAGMSSDGKMFMFDNSTVSLMSAETHQIFPIADLTQRIGSKGHPYHPHPNFANGYNLVAWGQVHNNVLGVAWMDYTDVLENEVAKGGRYDMGNNLTRVSYKGIECESDTTVKDGVECIYAKPGTSIFVDVNDDYIDNGNCAVKLTFDYYDNGTYPINIIYTKGLEEYNDFIKSYNKKVLVMRKGTGQWKTAEVTLDCVNLETAGKFKSDFKFSSAQGSAFIKNVKVELLNTDK